MRRNHIRHNRLLQRSFPRPGSMQHRQAVKDIGNLLSCKSLRPPQRLQPGEEAMCSKHMASRQVHSTVRLPPCNQVFCSMARICRRLSRRGSKHSRISSTDHTLFTAWRRHMARNRRTILSHNIDLAQTRPPNLSAPTLVCLKPASTTYQGNPHRRVLQLLRCPHITFLRNTRNLKHTRNQDPRTHSLMLPR